MTAKASGRRRMKFARELSVTPQRIAAAARCSVRTSHHNPSSTEIVLDT